MMNITNWTVDRGHNKTECSKLHWCEGKGRARRGKAMNEKNCFVSANCAYVAIRKCLKLTGKLQVH
jgi:hypothetical protein